MGQAPELRSPVQMMRRTETATSLRSQYASPPGTPSLRRPQRHTENLQTMRAQFQSAPTTPTLRRPQRHTENLQTMRTRLDGEPSARQMTFRLISASSSTVDELQGVDSEGNIVLPIDDLELETLQEGELVTLPHSSSYASLAAAGQVAVLPETGVEPPPDICETSSIVTDDSGGSQSGKPASSSWSGFSASRSNASLLEQCGPHLPPPTSQEYKSNRFRNNLAVVGSAMYATFLVMFGLIVFVADIAKPSLEIAEIYTFVQSVIGMLWLIALHVNVQMYMRRLAKVAKSTQGGLGALERQLILEPTEVEGEYRVRMPFKQTTSEMIKCQYSFSVGRHSGSFYLKIGASFFCFGHLVHLLLLLIRHINTLVQHGHECRDVPTVMLYAVQPVFSFFQLYITFKYSNIVINNHQTSARFGFMHCIASSLNMWVWSIVKETVDAVQEHEAEHHDAEIFNITNCSDCTISMALQETNLVYQKCVFNDTISETVTSLSGYLYPLTIEFNILIVGVWFVIWQNIGNTRIGQFLTGDMTDVEGVTNKSVLQVDCRRANRGLLGGLLVFVFVVVDVILFFSMSAEDAKGHVALYISEGSEVALTALMTVLCLLAYNKLTQLDINIHPISFLDDLLLFICLPAFFLFGIITLLPALFPSEGDHSTILDAMSPILLMIQVVIQTPFLMDGLRRCSNTDQLRADRPGREYVTVLLFSNLAMWLLQTLENQASEDSVGVHFYGEFVWTLLRHATMPLCLFYRFHSSVCLADVWKSAYEPGS